MELCTDLSCGGLTPDMRMVERSIEYAPRGGLQILVRPRPGDFIHNDDEIAEIARTIRQLKTLSAGAPIQLGYVVGVLRSDLTINRDAIARFRDEAEDAPLTFHRAFDQVPDQLSAVELLIETGYQRVLTTGGHPDKAQVDQLKRLITIAKEYSEHDAQRMIILISGGLRSHNVRGIVDGTGAQEVHMRAPGPDGDTSLTEVQRIIHALAGTDSIQ